MYILIVTEIFTTILFLIAIIDPLGSVPVYLEATKQFDQVHKRKVAIRVSIVAFLIVLFFILIVSEYFEWPQRLFQYRLISIIYFLWFSALQPVPFELVQR